MTEDELIEDLAACMFPGKWEKAEEFTRRFWRRTAEMALSRIRELSKAGNNQDTE